MKSNYVTNIETNPPPVKQVIQEIKSNIPPPVI